MNKKPMSTYNYNSRYYVPKQEFNSFTGNQILKEISLYNNSKNAGDGPTTLNLNDNGNTVVHNVLNAPEAQLTEEAKLYLIKQYFNQAVSLTTPNNFNITPLHIACHKQYKLIVDFLLKHGADPNCLDSQNKNPLHYLVQPAYHQCRGNSQKIADIIPKKGKITPKPTVELGDLSKLIIDVLTTDSFGNIYMKHIKRTTSNVDKMFESLFNAKLNEIKRDISLSLSDRSKQIVDRKDIILNTVLSGIKDVTKSVKDILNKSTKPVNISPNNTGYLLVMPYNSVEEQLKELLKNKITVSDLKSNVDQTVDNLGKVHHELNDVYRRLKQHLYIILMHNLHLKVNNNTVDLYSFIPDNELAELLRDDDLPLFNVEIDSFGTYDRNQFRILFNDTVMSKVKAYRLSRQDLMIVEKIRTANRRQIKEYPLTDDGADTLEGDNPVDVLAKPEILYVELVPDQIYFLSVFEYSINKIVQNNVEIVNSFKAIFNHIENDYFYEIYHRLGSQIYKLVLNSVQYLTLISNKRYYVKRKINQLQNKIYNMLPDVQAHKYEFNHYYMEQSVGQMVELEEKISKLLPVLYNSLIKVVNVNMNKIIDFINSKSSEKFIKSYYSVDFTATNTFQLNNVYDRQLNKYSELEKTFEDYVTAVDGSNITSSQSKLNSIKRKIFEKYVPQINLHNFSTYYAQTGFNYAPLAKINDVTDITPLTSGLVAQAGYLITVSTNAVPITVTKPLFKDSAELQGKLNPVDDTTFIGKIGVKLGGLIKDRSDSVEAVLNKDLDIHFTTLKFLLIQHILYLFEDENNGLIPNSMNQQIKNLKTTLLEYAKDEQSLYTIVGRIADQIITYNINVEIAKNVHYTLLKEVNIYDYDFVTPDFIPVQRDDRGFTLNFNEMIKELIDVFVNLVDDDNEYNKLLYTSKLMQDVNSNYNNKYEHTVNSTDYFSPFSTNMCVTVNLDIVDSLINANCNINQQDYNRQTPVYYCLDLMHTFLTSKLISKNASVKTVMNINNQTPLDMCIKRIQEHISLVLSDSNPVFYGLYNPVLDLIKLKINDNPNYKNNVIKGLDSLFAQTLCMIDHYFYTKILNVVSVNNQDNVRVLATFIKLLSAYNVVTEDEFYDVDSSLPLLNLNFDVITTDFALNVLNNNINKAYRQDDIQQHLQIHINMFKETLNSNNSNLSSNNAVQFYNTLFDETVGKLNDVFDEKGFDNYQLYNGMWTDFVNKSNKYMNAFNINVLALKLLQKMMYNNDNINSDELNVVNKTYQILFSEPISNFFELPQDELKTNYVLNDMILLMEHSLSKTLFSNLYTGVLKTVIKFDPNNKDTLQINDLKLYIVDEMPKLMIKVVLNKYYDEFDESKSLTVDQLFNTVTNLIKNTIYVDNDSSLIRNLDTYVYPYYKEVVTDVISGLYNVVINYLNYIKNQGNMVNILVLMLNAKH